MNAHPFPRPLSGLDLEPAILTARWVCPKADGYYSYRSTPATTGERPIAWLRRQWWDVRALIAVWHQLADRCPHIATGTALVRIAVRENEFTTTEHQAVHLRHLIAACPTCPQPERDGRP